MPFGCRQYRWQAAQYALLRRAPDKARDRQYDPKRIRISADTKSPSLRSRTSSRSAVARIEMVGTGKRLTCVAYTYEFVSAGIRLAVKLSGSYTGLSVLHLLTLKNEAGPNCCYTASG